MSLLSGPRNEAWIVYYTLPDHTAWAKVMLRRDNDVTYIEYSGFDRAGTTRKPIGKNPALALARQVFMTQPGAS